MTAPHNFSNTASAATLAGSLSASDTAVVLDSFANFPAPPFTATIARNQPTEEIVLVTDVTGLTVTLTRGYDGTSAQAQSPGATFEHTAVAKHFRDAAAHVAATASAHGTTSPVVGVNDVQTLSNKTVLALLALATAGAPALTADAPTGVTSKLLSLKQAGVEKAFVDYLGNLTAQGVTGTTGTFSGALSAGALTAAATTLASLAVSGTSAFTGAVTVPAPTTGGHPATKTYVDAADAALGSRVTAAEGTLTAATASPTANALVKRDASGNTAIDTVTLTDAPTAVGHATRKSYVDTADAALDARLDALEAAYAKGSSGTGTNASGEVVVNHPLGVVPSAVFVSLRSSAAEAQVKLVDVARSSTTITFKAYNTTNGAIMAGNPIAFDWLAFR